MILKYVIDLKNSPNQTIMVKEYLHKKIPAALITFLNSKNTEYLVNGGNVFNYYSLKNGDILEVVIPSDDPNPHIIPIIKEFKILYEDSYLLIIDKIANLACIPTHKHFENSLANMVVGYYRKKGIASGIHFVNRLDLPTSGIVILAKDSYTTTLMKEAIISKKYFLIVEGVMKESGVIKTGIEKDENSIIKRKVVDDYVNSKTIYQILKTSNQNSLIEATLCTGKTHQLRLHFSSLGYPIEGDKLYGNSDDNNLKLHSYELIFIHPITKEKITITSYPKWDDSLWKEYHQ